MKKTIRVLLAALLVCSLLVCGALAVNDEDRVITVKLGDTPIEFDVPPCLINDRTMVPLRFVSEALKAEVSWVDETQTAVVEKDGVKMEFTIGEPTMLKNGKEYFLDAPAVLINDRTLVPLRVISENFDVKVGWDDETSTVTLTEKVHLELDKDMFKLGNGFNVVDNTANYTTLQANYPVKAENAEDGVVITSGGYYMNAENWGGVGLKEALPLDGLSVTVRFDSVPEVRADDDCWMCIDFLQKPEAFSTGNVPGNAGFMDLIRFGSAGLEIYEGINSFAGVKISGYDRKMFKIESGDTVTVSAKLDEDDKYIFTFKANGSVYEWKYEADQGSSKKLTDVFEDGKAHIVIAASLRGEKMEWFKYTITDVAYFAE